MAEFVLALDQGTTSSRAILFRRDGIPAATAQREFEQIFPQPGHVEHDPEAIWSTQLAVARAVLKRARATPRDVVAIGVTNQRETTVLWERDSGKPVANAIVWQSRVTAGICERMKAEGLEKTFRRKTGLVLDAYFSGTKIRHLLDTIPGLRSRAEKGEILFGTIDCFLLWRLTGGRRHVTDYSNASRTLLFDIHALEWDDELLRLMDVPRAMLPEVRPSSEVYAETDPALFGEPIPIAGIAGDQQAATFGQACFEPGSAKNTYGTGCFMLLNTGDEAVASQHGLVTTIGWGIDGKVTYCLEGSIFIAGAVVQWLRDGLGLIRSAAEVEELASQVDDSGDVYLVPAFVGLGAPHWNQSARGTIVGITRGTTKAHIARAALESMAFQTRDVLEAMQQDAGFGPTVGRICNPSEPRTSASSGTPISPGPNHDRGEEVAAASTSETSPGGRITNPSYGLALKVDGGATANNLMMQFQADLLGVPVERPVVQETTALGAAYLAGLAVGFWENQADVARNWALDRRFEPDADSPAIQARHARWREAVRRSLDWAREE